MDRRTFLAIFLSFSIYWGWQKFYLEPRMHHPVKGSATQDQQREEETANFSQSLVDPSKTRGSFQDRRPHLNQLKLANHLKSVILQTQIGSATLANDGFFFSNWILKNYNSTLGPNASPVNLYSVTHQPQNLSFAVDQTELAYLSQVEGDFIVDSTTVKSFPYLQGQEQEIKNLSRTLWQFEDHQVKLTREFFSSPDLPYLWVVLKSQFKQLQPRYAFVSIASQGLDQDPEAQDRQLVYGTQSGIERLALKDSLQQKAINTPIQYIGALNRYFTMAVVNDSQNTTELPSALVQSTDTKTGRISMVYPVTGKSTQIVLKIYFGPKELSLLREVHPQLDQTIEYGRFSIVAYPLLTILQWLYQYVHNYGIAICVLTLLLKICMFPLTYKSMKSMKKMTKLQPKLQNLKEQFKNDRDGLNREMMILMRDQGYNPMAGCLPILIQMPIFYALYRVLYSSIQLYHAPFFLWIRDLSTRDPYYVTPILLSISMFLQQKLSPQTTTDPTQAKMMQIMPLLFGAFMISLPSGLTIYMLVNALASIVQQIILNKKFDELTKTSQPIVTIT